jgi:hypothetical protein
MNGFHGTTMGRITRVHQCHHCFREQLLSMCNTLARDQIVAHGATLHHAIIARATLHHAIIARATLHHAIIARATLCHAIIARAELHAALPASPRRYLKASKLQVEFVAITIERTVEIHRHMCCFKR